MTDTSDTGPQPGLEIQDQLRILGGKFLSRTRDQTAQLRQWLRDLPHGAEPLAPLEEIAHKIHGSGAMFGFAAISTCAGEMESLVEGLIAAKASLDASTIQRLNGLVDQLERCVQEALDTR